MLDISRKQKSLLVLCGFVLLGTGLFAGFLIWGRHSGRLDTDEATSMLKPYVNEGSAPCVWRRPLKRTDTVWQILVDEANLGCAKALVDAGLAKTGACFERGCTLDCCYLEIAPTGRNDSKWGKDGLEFSCGALQFGAVTGIATKDNVATVTYTRTAVLDEKLLRSLEACILEKTEGGEKERTRTFQRVDNGSWRMLDP